MIISPSEVVRRLIEKSGKSFELELKLFLISLAKDNVDVVLLPHSFGIGDSKNNDVDMCKKLYLDLKNIPNIHLIDDVREPILLRAIIGEADIFIGCRFHGVRRWNRDARRGRFCCRSRSAGRVGAGFDPIWQCQLATAAGSQHPGNQRRISAVGCL